MRHIKLKYVKSLFFNKIFVIHISSYLFYFLFFYLYTKYYYLSKTLILLL